MNWDLVYTKQAKKDAKKIAASGLKSKVKSLLCQSAFKTFQAAASKSFQVLVGFNPLFSMLETVRIIACFQDVTMVSNPV